MKQIPNIARIGISGLGFTSVMPAVHYRRAAPEDIVSGRLVGFFLVPMMLRMGLRLKDVLSSVPDPWFKAVRDGRAYFILDNSPEGESHADSRSADWHNFLAEREIPASRCIHITQDRNYSHAYADWCSRNGVQDQIAILYYHYFIRSFFGELRETGTKLFEERIRLFERAQTPEKDFVSLNYKARPHRVAFLTRLLRDELWDRGFVTFGGFEQEKIISAKASWKRADPVEKFLRLPIAAESRQYLAALAEKGEVLIGRMERVDDGQVRLTSLVGDGGLDIFSKSSFSVVGETEMRPTQSRITEKPFKALANFHPIILLGNKSSLPLIRELGFETFDRLIDESYDEVADPNDRFNLAYDEFRRLLNPDRLKQIRSDAAFRRTLIANAEHALITMPRRVEYMDLNLCEALSEIASGAGSEGGARSPRAELDQLPREQRAVGGPC